MILMGRNLCLPSPATVQELFSVARDASIIPDISLDPVLTTFLSLDSSATLQHQYVFLQRSMSGGQQNKFSLNLTEELGGSSRVTYGGVGVVALALSLLFDQVAQQVRFQGSVDGDLLTHRSQSKRIFGISSSSKIGVLIHSYLNMIPGIANNQEKMAETTELYDRWLKLEMIDHYERMTTKKRMSTVSMQQWVTGAALHLHMRIHQVRLNSVPLGSAESLRLSYKAGLSHLVQGYTRYLRTNIQETSAPGLRKLKTRTGSRHSNTSSITNLTCSNNHICNVSQVHAVSALAERSNKAIGPNVTDESRRGNVSKEGQEPAVGLVSRKPFTNSTGFNRGEEVGTLGLLVIEPLRNVSHNVQHHPCQSQAIQEALVTRIMNAQDLERNRNFFLYPEKVFRSLLRQKDDFELKTN